jgi:hypothetical protein
MGLTKKILFGDDPAHDGIRAAWCKAAADRAAGFPFPIQTKRKNRIGRRSTSKRSGRRPGSQRAASTVCFRRHAGWQNSAR